MELKTARLTLLIDPDKKAAFERLCAQLDLTASQVVRQLIRDFLAEHRVSYLSGGRGEQGAAPAEPPARPSRKASRLARPGGPKPAKPAKPTRSR